MWGTWLKRGFWIWLWTTIIWFAIGILLSGILFMLGTSFTTLEKMIWFIILWTLITIPISWIILGWASSKVLRC